MSRSASVVRAFARAWGPPNESSTTYRRTQYGDPITSSGRTSGSASRNEPAALRSRSPAQAGRAAFPHAHQPHRVGAGWRDIVPCGGRHVGQRHPPPGGPRQVAQPDRGVDLVDHGLVWPSGHRGTWASLRPALRPPPPRAPFPTDAPGGPCPSPFARCRREFRPDPRLWMAGRLPECRRPRRRASPGWDDFGRFGSGADCC